MKERCLNIGVYQNQIKLLV